MKESISWKPVLLPVGLCVKNEMIWFIQNGGNQLMGVDIHSFQIKKRLRIPCVPWGNSFFHRELNDRIIDIGNKILILLNGSNVIYAYDFSSDAVEEMAALPKGEKFLNNGILYKDGCLVLLPYQSKYVLKYHVYNDLWRETQISDYDISMEKQLVMENDTVLAVNKYSNSVYHYNLLKDSMEEVSIGDKDNQYWGIMKAGGYYVLPHSEKKALTLWKPETEEIYEILDFPADYRDMKGYSYLNMYRAGNDVLLIPYCANMILKINITDMSISNDFKNNCFWLRDCADKIDGSKMAYYASVIWDKKIYLYSVIQQNWHVVDTNTMSLKVFPKYKISGEDEEYIGKLFDVDSKKYFMGNESKYNCCNLNNYALSVRNCIGHQVHSGIYIGLDIWNSLK